MKASHTPKPKLNNVPIVGIIRLARMGELHVRLENVKHAYARDHK